LEYSLLKPIPDALPVFAIKPHPEDWAAIFRWISPENNLGFALFNITGCPGIGKDRDAKR
jgi:hypothetical protein